MASIDRYRPPREGYQPPPIPAPSQSHPPHPPPPPPAPAPPPHRQDRTSRSPVKRRDGVPPPAPSPPTHTSRTSPPRPLSRRELQSPRRHNASSSQPQAQSQSQSQQPPTGREPSGPPSQWFFTADEVKSSPSIVDGLSPTEERLRRAKGVNFIYQAGVLLDLPQITLWVAGVYFHRFYMRYSMVEEKEKGGVHHYNIAATALFLANKTEENCRKTKDIIITVAKVAQKNAKLIIDEQSKEYWRWRDSILMYEELMLELLTFDLMVDNPYHRLFSMLSQLEIVHNKHLRQIAWAFCNDCCLTAIPLLMDSRDVAIASIFFASVHTEQRIDDVRGEAWWRFLSGDEDKCAQAIDIMDLFWRENPLRKQNPAISSPAFLLDNTRRRGDAMLSQTETLSSAAPTPLDLDRGTQSPRGAGGARVNGAGGGGGGAAALGRDEASFKRSFDDSTTTTLRDGAQSSQTAVGESSQKEARGNGATTPLKRKDARDDAADDDRAPKRKRASDLDEGETGEI